MFRPEMLRYGSSTKALRHWPRSLVNAFLFRALAGDPSPKTGAQDDRVEELKGLVDSGPPAEALIES